MQAYYEIETQIPPNHQQVASMQQSGIEDLSTPRIPRFHYVTSRLLAGLLLGGF
jgi:hypothetical protein